MKYPYIDTSFVITTLNHECNWRPRATVSLHISNVTKYEKHFFGEKYENHFDSYKNIAQRKSTQHCQRSAKRAAKKLAEILKVPFVEE